MAVKSINVAVPATEHRIIRRIAKEKKWSIRTALGEAVRVYDATVKQAESPQQPPAAASDNGKRD